MNFFSTFFITFFIAGLFHSVKGLQCYVTVSLNSGNEKVVSCEEVMLLPTVEQMSKIIQNPSNQMSKRGKVVCRKYEFMKECAFVAETQEMGCSKKLSDEKATEALQMLAVNERAMLPYRDCYCDTDRCNDGNILKITSLGSLASVLITILAGKCLE